MLKTFSRLDEVFDRGVSSLEIRDRKDWKRGREAVEAEADRGEACPRDSRRTPGCFALLGTPTVPPRVNGNRRFPMGDDQHA